MKDKTLVGGIVVMVMGAVLIGVVWLLFLQPARTPTAPIAAVPVEIAAGGDNFTIFEIIPAESKVTFVLDETLRGLPTTVVGQSREVAGQIAVNFDQPAASQIGPLLINARTLFTDNSFRDNAIHSVILDSQRYEFITFTPGQITGLPEAFVPDEAVMLQISGELVIRETTQPVTFSATVVANGRFQLTGSATAQISRTAFNLQIPNAPGVANVSDEVQLTIEFVAAPAN